ncbi:MAG: hypothetical protein M1399_05785 [Actinobacteria bacterium]|nr:hypothetical protein [Actinomycetota bacterium]
MISLDCPPADVPDDRWMALAIGTGCDLIEIIRHGGPSGNSLDAGVVYVAHNDVFSLSHTRGGDLLSGAGGIAVVLAELSALSGVDSFGEEAVRQADIAIGACTVLSEEMDRWSGAPSDVPVNGMYTGLASSLYCLKFLARIGGVQTASEAISTAIAQSEESLVAFDFETAFASNGWLQVAPVASLLAVLSSEATYMAGDGAPVGSEVEGSLSGIRTDTSCSDTSCSQAGGNKRAGNELSLSELRDRLAEIIVANWGKYFPAFPINPVMSDLFPSERAMAILALSRHADPTRMVLPHQMVNWLDQASEPASADRLIAISLGKKLPDPAVPSTSLGCINVIEERLLSYRYDANGRQLASAREIGTMLAGRKESYGRWFPEAVLPDRYRLSAMWGLAAVAHAFAGLGDPRRWCSMRLLEYPDVKQSTIKATLPPSSELLHGEAFRGEHLTG